MKFILKTWVFALCMLAGALSLQAQYGGGGFDPVKMAERTTRTMTDSLSLSTRQTEKVGEINLKYAKLLQQARDKNTGGDWESMRAAMTTMRQEQGKELQAVLTSYQWERWQKVQETMWQGRGDRSGNNNRQPKKEKSKRS